MRNWYQLTTLKQSVYISLVCALLGSIQMALFLPDGVSCADGSSSLLDGILFFMPVQLLIVFLLGLLNKELRTYVIPAFLLLFWLYINKHEFVDRKACWSTFSEAEVLKVVLLKSALTCTVCLLPLYFFYKKFWIKYS
ncbi:MAG: MFS transporter [Chryseobacterium sp.]|nr:MAG: MFS transporter [Chryseobacterium sp.]